MILISLFLGSVMLAIASIHYYWAFGGKKWVEAVIPTKPGAEGKAFLPGSIVTFIAATLFLSVAMHFILLSSFFTYPFSTSVANKVTWVIGVTFLLRGLGDFRYFGLAKKVKNTAFAKMDSYYYTPLVFLLGFLTLLLTFQLNGTNA
jgi:hypothetical protein